MPPPYAEDVGDRDPIEVLRESADRYREVLSALPDSAWRAPWAPGKWSGQEILVHVAQWEMILGLRLRCGVAVPGYVVQPIDQDLLMREARALAAPVASTAFLGVRAMNLAFAASLTGEDRARTFQHAERGTIAVNDLLVTLAGHGVHHLRQLQTLAPAKV